MSSVNSNDPRIKKVNFRKAMAGDISLLLGTGSGASNSAEDSYFARWEEKNQHLLAEAMVKVNVEEYKDVRLTEWGARVDPYIIISLGNTKVKTQVFKRSQSSKVNQLCDFPLPSDYQQRSWELSMEVFDAQSNNCIGAIYLNLNDIFSEDADSTLRTPLVLSYTSITVPLEPVRWGEDVCGTITFSLSSSVMLPKVPLIRDRFVGFIDAQMNHEAKMSILTAKEKAYMTQLEEAVNQMDEILPNILTSVGGPTLLQMMLGDNYAPSLSSYLTGSSSSSSPSLSGLSTPKMKNFLKQGLAALSGSTSSLAKGKMAAAAGADTVTVNDLPNEILMRIFSHLPPWSSLSVRRVNRLWDSLSMPQLPDLWAMFHWFQKLQNANGKNAELFTTFCDKAFPFMVECSRIVQFVTSLSFNMGSIPIPNVDRTKPLVLGPIESALGATRILVYLDLWKSAVISAIKSQANPQIYVNAIGGFRSHYATHLSQEKSAHPAVLAFDDTNFWNTAENFFNPSHSFTQSLPYVISQEDVIAMAPYTETIKLQLEKKKFTSDDEARYLCTSYILLHILAKISAPTMVKLKSRSHPLSVLKEYESIIPLEMTHLLISQGIMKDRTYTKFSS